MSTELSCHRPEGLPGWVRKDADGMQYAIIPEMYAEYRNWCESEGEEPVNAIKFGKKLAAWVVDYDSRKKQRKIGGRPLWTLDGLTAQGFEEW